MKGKKKKRRLKKSFLAFALLFVVCLLSLSSRLFLKTYKISLAKQLQKAQTQIDLLTLENEELSLTVSSLSSHTRVMEIAKEAGLDSISQNVETVSH